jgi:hypothetical protein
MEPSQPIDPLIPPKLEEFEGDWDTYQEKIYKIFCTTICDTNLTFQGQRIGIKRQPEYNEKHFSFWHITSEGEKEEDRTPDLRRCERIRWVNWIITNCDNHPGILSWENKRGGQTHIVIWCEEHNYAVILAKRNGYYLLKTAYLVSARRETSFRKEHKEFLKKNR